MHQYQRLFLSEFWGTLYLGLLRPTCTKELKAALCRDLSHSFELSMSAVAAPSRWIPCANSSSHSAFQGLQHSLPAEMSCLRRRRRIPRRLKGRLRKDCEKHWGTKWPCLSA